MSLGARKSCILMTAKRQTSSLAQDTMFSSPHFPSCSFTLNLFALSYFNFLFLFPLPSIDLTSTPHRPIITLTRSDNNVSSFDWPFLLSAPRYMLYYRVPLATKHDDRERKRCNKEMCSLAWKKLRFISYKL